MSSSPAPPPPPDYAGAAVAQGAANKETAIAQAMLNNPNVTNPYGSQSVSYSKEPGSGNFVPTVNQTLSPEQQKLFDQYGRINEGLGGVAEQGLGYVQNALDKPFDTSKLPAASINAGQTAQDAILSRIEPQITRDREALNQNLSNQGIKMGQDGEVPEAYKTAQTLQGQKENDLRIGAALQGIQTGDQARQQSIQEQAFLRNEPVNMLNAVRSSAPVNVPQFSGYSGAPIGQTPVFNAATQQYGANMDTYNSQVGQANANNQGLYSLAGAGLGLMAFSDRRLKRNVRKVGQHRLGIGLYAYTINGTRQVGVMAQDVQAIMPEAVLVRPDGYLMVNYGMIGAT